MNADQWFVHYTANGTNCIAGPYSDDDALAAKQGIERSDGNTDVFICNSRMRDMHTNAEKG